MAKLQRLIDILGEGLYKKPPELDMYQPIMYGSLYNVPLDYIEPNPANPRKNFDPAAMEELAQSIREVGILQPLVLVERGDKMMIVAGERRWRAAQLAGLASVPALVMDLTDAQVAEIMLVENLQRKDLDPIEEAQAYRALLEGHGYTQEALAEKIGVSQGHIANRLRLLELPETVRENISRGIISPSHGKVLAGHKNLPAEMLEKAAASIAEKNVPVAKAAHEVTKLVAATGLPLFNHWRDKPLFKLAYCLKDCKYKAMGTSYEGAPEYPYCMNRECWERKQAEAERDLIEKAKKAGKEFVDIGKLNYDQYEYWTEGAKDYDQAECLTCEKRKLGKWQDEKAEMARFYCLDPACMRKKRAAKTREENKAKKTAFQEELAEAQKLAGAWVEGTYYDDLEGAALFERPALLYLAAQILGNCDVTYGRDIALYRWCKERFGWKDEVLRRRNWGMLVDQWDTMLKLLETLDDRQLLQIIFEWPAAAMGMKGAAGWFLKQAPAGKEGVA